MKQIIKPCQCGSKEFITQPNQYDVYQIIKGKLELTDTLNTDEEEELFCRDCGKKMKLK